jgi:CheY-like chemotaxis protein
MASQLTDSVIEAFREEVGQGPRPVPPPAPWHGPLKVLCVDDNADAADSLAAVLDLLGCDTRVCYSGVDALAAFPEVHPDVCFLDLMMPGMDGLEVAGRLRAMAGTRAVFIVAVTALGSLEDRTRTAITGFHYHLIKPVDATTLAQLVNDIEALLLNHHPEHPAGS